MEGKIHPVDPEELYKMSVAVGDAVFTKPDDPTNTSAAGNDRKHLVDCNDTELHTLLSNINAHVFRDVMLKHLELNHYVPRAVLLEKVEWAERELKALIKDELKRRIDKL